MNRKHAYLFFFTVLCAFFYIPASSAQDTNGCIQCHTDEAKLKALYVPPELKFDLDEGEG
jgi:hypothetical protein